MAERLRWLSLWLQNHRQESHCICQIIKKGWRRPSFCGGSRLWRKKEREGKAQLYYFQPLCVESVATPQSDGQIAIQGQAKVNRGKQKGEENQLHDSPKNEHFHLSLFIFKPSTLSTVSLCRAAYRQWLRLTWGTNNSSFPSLTHRVTQLKIKLQVHMLPERVGSCSRFTAALFFGFWFSRKWIVVCASLVDYLSLSSTFWRAPVDVDK